MLEDHDWSEERKAKLRNLDLGEWLKRHPHERVERLLRDLTPTLGFEVSNSNIFVVGYCFGGKHAIRMSSWPEVKGALTFHPVRSFHFERFQHTLS